MAPTYFESDCNWFLNLFTKGSQSLSASAPTFPPVHCMYQFNTKSRYD